MLYSAVQDALKLGARVRVPDMPQCVLEASTSSSGELVLTLVSANGKRIVGWKPNDAQKSSDAWEVLT